MSQELWTTVNSYISNLLIPTDGALSEALASSAAAGLPSIAVSPPQGKLLHLMARMTGARSILEIGTLGGYSTIWLARALPEDGKLITLEAETKHAEVAKRNVERAGLSHLVEIRVGSALDTLPELESSAPFDFTFIDADKVNIPEYFNWALRLSRKGSVIVVDNVVRDGEIANDGSSDASVLAVRRLNEIIASERRVSATVVQTVGSKGYDGFTLAMVLSDS